MDSKSLINQYLHSLVHSKISTDQLLNSLNQLKENNKNPDININQTIDNIYEIQKLIIKKAETVGIETPYGSNVTKSNKGHVTVYLEKVRNSNMLFYSKQSHPGWVNEVISVKTTNPSPPWKPQKGDS
ncbi:hypothetical protein E2L07_20200 [Halalkalibacterium halodurans]|uniref:hypothetical protein n=1 Tax=Bacillaceae TaxID=186817 RepID=UPI001067EDAA|nr:hypothetical protein [Halalkalibacterium halodurans]TES45807.1 hypothetical protein E2L07_20200 [Halalkalibacterium halodurans]